MTTRATEITLISSQREIEAALKATPYVFCALAGQDPARGFPVRDVRTNGGDVEVKVLEGWRKPVAVWVEHR